MFSNIEKTPQCKIISKSINKKEATKGCATKKNRNEKKQVLNYLKFKTNEKDIIHFQYLSLSVSIKMKIFSAGRFSNSHLHFQLIKYYGKSITPRDRSTSALEESTKIKKKIRNEN
jgi:hypothetical protein